jgi:transposase
MEKTLYVGLDIGKDAVDVAVPASNDGFSCFRENNNEIGFLELEKKLLRKKAELAKKGHQIDYWLISEATGIYYLPIHDYFVKKGWKFTVVNPLSIKRFRDEQLQNVKTDKEDCKLIAKYGYNNRESLKVTPEIPEDVRQVEQMQVLRRALKKQKDMFSSVAENIHFATVQNSKTVPLLDELQTYHEKALKKLENDMIAYIKKTNPKEYECLVSIPSVGVNMIIEIYTETNLLKRFQNLNQFLSYAGIAPANFESGTSVYKKPKLGTFANRNLRFAFIMSGMSALKCNPDAIALDKKLNKNITGRGRHVAAGRLVAKQVWYCVKNLEKYTPAKDRVKVGERKVGGLVVELVYEEPQSALRSISNDSLISSFESGK